jgi:ABC-2 type transport system permease protein
MQFMNRDYINLVLQMSITDFRLKYSGSVLGYLWSIVKPLLLFGVLYVVFTYFFSLGKGIKDYPVYLLIGIVFWSFFADGTMNGMHSVVNRGDLIRKVNFPKLVIVLAAIITSFLTFVLNLVIVLVFLALAKIVPSTTIVVLLPAICEMTLLILGVSLILSTLYVKFRDMAHIWEVFIQILFYATPIIYPISYIPEDWKKLLMINPVAQIIQDIRWAFLGRDVVTSESILPGALFLLPIALTVIILLVGLLLFSKTADSFAEEI